MVVSTVQQSYSLIRVLPWWFSGEESACNARAPADAGLILGWEDPLEDGVTTCSSILSPGDPMGRGIWRAVDYGVARSDTAEGT